MERWIGRVAAVTGASSGIGEAIAKELCKQGMKVAAIARRVEKLQALQQECKNSKGSIKTYKCDISDESDIASVVKRITVDLGPVSVLVNNAGIFLPAPLTDTSQGSCRKGYETNVIGLVTMTQHIVEKMRKNDINDGHIININSVAGHSIMTSPGFANYCASKNAVTVISESLRSELAALKTKIRVTSLSPGMVKTDLSSGVIENTTVPIPYLNPEDIVDAVVCVLSTKPHVNISELTIQPVGENTTVLAQ